MTVIARQSFEIEADGTWLPVESGTYWLECRVRSGATEADWKPGRTVHVGATGDLKYQDNLAHAYWLVSGAVALACFWAGIKAARI